MALAFIKQHEANDHDGERCNDDRCLLIAHFANVLDVSIGELRSHVADLLYEFREKDGKNRDIPFMLSSGGENWSGN